MGWLSKIPRISLLLLIATYGVFGWLYSSWVLDVTTKTHWFDERLNLEFAIAIIYGMGLFSIIIIITCFTTPTTLLTLGMANWFRADTQAILSIAISIVIFAIVVEYPAFLGRFLVLSAAAMLFRLDLQTLGYSYKIAQTFLVCLSLIAFTLGAVIFYFYGV